MQHRPLNKGAHTQASLAKSFADTDPSMRPRVWAPTEVRKAHTPLTTADIEGAQVCVGVGLCIVHAQAWVGWSHGACLQSSQGFKRPLA